MIGPTEEGGELFNQNYSFLYTNIQEVCPHEKISYKKTKTNN